VIRVMLFTSSAFQTYSMIYDFNIATTSSLVGYAFSWNISLWNKSYQLSVINTKR